MPDFLPKFVLVMLVLLGGCAPDITDTEFFSRHPDPDLTPEGDIVLAEHTNGDVQIRILSPDNLKWGFNQITLETQGAYQNLSVSAFLDTGSSRIESPLGSSASVDAPLIHVLDPGIPGDWTLEVAYSTGQGNFITVYPIVVEEDIWVQPIGTQKRFVSWISPEEPKTGADSFEIAIHEFDGFSFIPLTSSSVDLYPYMDMGAGEGHSTPYVAPTHIGDGRYRGEVNFIMSGGWDMTVMLNGNENVIFKGFTVR